METARKGLKTGIVLAASVCVLAVVSAGQAPQPGPRLSDPQRGELRLLLDAQQLGGSEVAVGERTYPAGYESSVHSHTGIELIYVLSGEVHTWYGDELENLLVARAGDFFYIPAGVPHLPANLSSEPASAVIARTDPNEQESVVLLPHLDGRVPG